MIAEKRDAIQSQSANVYSMTAFIHRREFKSVTIKLQIKNRLRSSKTLKLNHTKLSITCVNNPKGNEIKE